MFAEEVINFGLAGWFDEGFSSEGLHSWFREDVGYVVAVGSFVGVDGFVDEVGGSEGGFDGEGHFVNSRFGMKLLSKDLFERDYIHLFAKAT